MKKLVKKAFGKTVYLLGKDKEGVYYWLESASWDCDWYWGFGYVETYTNNKCPDKAKDINSHQHFNGLFFNKNKNGYNEFKDFFEETTLSDDELWKLLELMKSFYILKDCAELLHLGGAHYTENPCKNIIKNEEEENRINKIVLPAIFKEIYSILGGTEQ